MGREGKEAGGEVVTVEESSQARREEGGSRFRERESEETCLTRKSS